MRVYRLTSVGLALASNPSNDTSDERKVICWLRRRGYSGTDEQIKDLFGGDGMRARLTLNNLLRGDAPRIVELSNK